MLPRFQLMTIGHEIRWFYMESALPPDYWIFTSPETQNFGISENSTKHSLIRPIGLNRWDLMGWLRLTRLSGLPPTR